MPLDCELHQCFSVLPSPQVGQGVIEWAEIGYFRFPHIGSLKIFPVAQMVKNLSAMQETQVQSLGREDPLEKGMATHSSIVAWRLSWTEEPGGLQSVGSQRVKHD